MKARKRSETLLPRHIVYHSHNFFWRKGPAALMIPDTINPDDLEAVAAELRVMRKLAALDAHTDSGEGSGG